MQMTTSLNVAKAAAGLHLVAGNFWDVFGGHAEMGDPPIDRTAVNVEAASLHATARYSLDVKEVSHRWEIHRSMGRRYLPIFR